MRTFMICHWEKITHRGKERLRIDFPYNRSFIKLLQTHFDAKWSKTLRSWHIADTPEYRLKLEGLLAGLSKDALHKSAASGNKPVPERMPKVDPSSAVAKDITVEVIGNRILLKMPKREADVKFITDMQYVRWLRDQYLWQIPNYGDNLERIKAYFSERIKTLTEHTLYTVQVDASQKIVVKKDSVTIARGYRGRMRVLFGYDKRLMNEIKQIGLNKWDSKNKWWSVPDTDINFDRIKMAAERFCLPVEIFENTQRSSVQPRRMPENPAMVRPCPPELTEKLKELRYASSTIKIYYSAFLEFVNFYNKEEVDQLSERQIVAYLRYLVMERQVSESTQNQAINAIKFYYERVLGGQRRVYHIDRPRREKTLPAVLSTGEISSLIHCTSNLKHKILLMIAYGGGLRVSEVINLRLIDVDTANSRLFIHLGKGGKDRYTLLSQNVIRLYAEYISSYQPKEFVFESPAGGRYTASSAQKIFNQAATRAGIKKTVSFKALRHSFATHLLESGTDLWYIQHLLGHKSSKTTEIYTHVTTRGWENLHSPLDNLDV